MNASSCEQTYWNDPDIGYSFDETPFYYANLVLLVIGVPYVVLSSLLMYARRKQPSLEKRSHRLIAVFAFGTLVQFLNGVVPVVVGYMNFPCLLYQITVYLYVIVVVSATLLRVPDLLFKHEFNEGCNSVDCINPEATHQLRNEFTKKKQRARLLVACLCVPYIGYCVYEYATIPMYREGCYGCNLESRSVNFTSAYLIFLMLCFGRYMSKLHKYEDLSGVKRELKLIVLIGAVVAIINIVLRGTGIERVFSADFNGTYILSIALLVIHTIQCVFPTARTFRWCNTNGAKCVFVLPCHSHHGHGDDLTLQQVLNDKTLTKYYAAHLQAELGAENLRFFEETVTWKRNFASRSHETSFDVGRSIFQTFVKENAVMQVNLSFECRSKLEAMFGGTKGSRGRLVDLDETAFDSARTSVFRSMESDSFRRFKRGKFYAQGQYKQRNRKKISRFIKERTSTVSSSRASEFSIGDDDGSKVYFSGRRRGGSSKCDQTALRVDEEGSLVPRMSFDFAP